MKKNREAFLQKYMVQLTKEELATAGNGAKRGLAGGEASAQKKARR